MNLDHFKQLLEEVAKNKLPDLHMTTGLVPYIRQHNGAVLPVDTFGVLTAELAREIASFVLPADRRGTWPDEKEMDASFEHAGTRFRVNAYYESRGPSFAIRLITSKIPTVKELELPDAIVQLTERGQGLILVTGATGSGKSTTLAAIIDHINTHSARHIITVEDPIEYVYQPKKSLIHQREISVHTQSFPKAIRSSLREDPDVIMIGEMRDAETMAAALTLAETGHLVLSTLHTNDTVQAIDRIVDSFPTNQQSQIRVQLSMSLSGILSQVLLAHKSGTGRIAAREVLINNDAIKSLIIQGATHQIYSMIELGSSEGMILMDRALESLYMKGKIAKEVFFSRIRDKDLLSLHRNTTNEHDGEK